MTGTRDLGRIYALQGLRAFIYGFGSVLLGSVLAASGMTGLQVGVVLAAMLAGSAFMSLVLVRHAESIGRRRVYLLLYGLLGIAGTVFALTDSFLALTIAALTGTVSVEVTESGPFTSLEQAMIPQVAGVRTTHVFGVYNAVASLVGAAGALLAGVPALVLGAAGEGNRLWFLVYPVVAVAALIVGRGLSPAVEAEEVDRTDPDAGRLVESRSLVYRLTALFALDSFAGGFIVQSFIVFWFQRKFGAGTPLLGAVIAVTGVIQAFSFLAATRIAARVGLLNTMVFTHLPSNLMLMALPFISNMWLAIVVFIVRFPLSQMDVPTRQGYLAELTPPQERAAAAGVTNAGRTLARPLAAPLAGLVAGASGAGGLPFIIAGGLKSIYDVVLYLWFRKVPIGQERRAAPKG